MNIKKRLKALNLREPKWFWLVELSLLLWVLFRVETLHMLFVRLTIAMGDAFQVIQFLIDQIVILMKGKGA